MTVPESPDALSASGDKPLDHELDVFGLTHVGKVRKTNQDHFLIGSLRKTMDVHLTSLPGLDELPLRGERLAYLGMVADGVGGEAGGEEASRLAIQAVVHYVAESMQCYYTADPANEQAFHDALQDVAMRCHQRVAEEAARHPDLERMATTLTLWIGVWPSAYLLQVGDSRCYLFRNGELTQITRDQTMAQELVDQGVFTETDARRTPWAHVLSSAIGGQQTVPVVTRLDQSWNDVGLLCSDGLTKHVSDDRIRERLETMTSARQVCRALVQDALDDGGTDNITVIVGRTARRQDR